MLSDADYEVMRNHTAIAFEPPQQGGEIWDRLLELADKGLVKEEKKSKEYSANTPVRYNPIFIITPLGNDALAEYDSHQKAKRNDDKNQRFDKYFNRGLAVVALIISVIALLKQ